MVTYSTDSARPVPYLEWHGIAEVYARSNSEGHRLYYHPECAQCAPPPCCSIYTPLLRWETVIPFVPGGGAVGQEAGVLEISASLRSIDGDGGILGSAGPSGVWRDYPTISYSGTMEFDSSDVERMEADGSLLGVILHEMGHVIGIGWVPV